MAGKLRHRITIQTPTTVTDGYGGSYETWLPIIDPTDSSYDANAFDAATVWASVGPVRGREFWDVKKSNSEVEGKIVMRPRTITPEQRIYFKGRYLKILAILNPAERNEYLEVYYKEWQ